MKTNPRIYNVAEFFGIIAVILVLLSASAFGIPVNIQKDGGALTQSFTVPSGISISATGTGTIAATTVTGFAPASGKVLTLSNTLTFTGTDSSSVNFGAGGTVLYSGGSYVSSIAGTTNQISASSSTGAVTLSLAGPHAFTTLTSTALLLGAGTSPISASDITYSTPTLSVPDAFAISSAGSIALTAGGTNKGIALTPSGTGSVSIVLTPSGASATAFSISNILSGTTSTQSVTGLNFDVRNNASSGSNYDVFGFAGNVRSTGAANVATMTGARVIALVSGGGTVTSATGYTARSPSVTSGAITTAYGFYSESQKATGVTTGYGFYQAGANDTNYFEGPITLTNVAVAVPNLWTITSAGSIAFTAGSTDKSITLTPSDAGSQGAVFTRAAYGSQTIIGTGGLQVVKEAVSGSIFPSLELIGYQNGQTAQMFHVIGKAGGTAASPSNASANATVGGYRFYVYANSGWRNGANISVGTSTTFGSADWTTILRMGPSNSAGQADYFAMAGGDGSIGTGAAMAFGNAASVATFAAKTFFTFDSNNFSRTSSWGTTGVNIAVVARTYTDTVSSGTVSTAVGNSIGIPTFAASSSTTFTDAINLFIGGAAATTGSASGTRKHAVAIQDGRLTLGFKSAVSSTSSEDGLWLGTDINFYRTGANTATITASSSLSLVGSFTAGGNLTAQSGDLVLTSSGSGGKITGTGGTLVFKTAAAGTTTALTLSATQNATFAGTITLLGGATLLTTSSALTDGVGAALGTLATAPTAGNPTKWIGINDNGTTRYVPAW